MVAKDVAMTNRSVIITVYGTMEKTNIIQNAFQTKI